MKQQAESPLDVKGNVHSTIHIYLGRDLLAQHLRQAHRALLASSPVSLSLRFSESPASHHNIYRNAFNGAILVTSGDNNLPSYPQGAQHQKLREVLQWLQCTPKAATHSHAAREAMTANALQRQLTKRFYRQATSPQTGTRCSSMRLPQLSVHVPDPFVCQAWSTLLASRQL